ncbi:translation machinery-associated protein 16 [Coemansia sp. S610]|nr:translation machinery-associated protein 16 [Coemansia sp. S610]
MCLLGAFPALTVLRCSLSGLGPEFEVIRGELPDYFVSTYGALGKSLRIWHVESADFNGDRSVNIVECIMLLALVCPNIRRIDAARCKLRNYNAKVARALRRGAFSKYALQLGPIFGTTYSGTPAKQTLLGKPNNKRKRVSKIKDKEKAHPYSRKARQINRAMHKETNIAKAKSERINAAMGRGQKIIWFRDNMDQTEDDDEEEVDAKLKKKVWTMVELRQLVDVYLARNDEDVETLLAKKEEGKNLLQKESLFLQLVDLEVKEAKLAGVEVPDLTNGAVVKALRAWDGDLNSITTIKLITCKPASIIPIEEEAKNSRRGDGAKADKVPQLLTEQQAIEMATGMAVN